MTAPVDVLAGISPTQLRALRELAYEPNPKFSCSMGGNARGPILSACRALVRKGLMWSPGGSRFGLTDAGLPIANEALSRWRTERAAAKRTEPNP